MLDSLLGVFEFLQPLHHINRCVDIAAELNLLCRLAFSAICDFFDCCKIVVFGLVEDFLGDDLSLRCKGG